MLRTFQRNVRLVLFLLSNILPPGSQGRSRGAIISQYYNRTVRLRRRSSRPLLGNVVRSARPSLRLYDLELDSTILEEDGELTNPVCWLGRSRTDCNRVTSLFLLSDCWRRSFPGLALRPHPPPPNLSSLSAEEACGGWLWSAASVRALSVLLAGGDKQELNKWVSRSLELRQKHRPSLLGGFLGKVTGVEEAGTTAHRLEPTRLLSKPTWKRLGDRGKFMASGVGSN